MLDTIKRQKLFFISLIGIVVVSLTMGVTYAYQSLVVEEAEGSKIGMTLNAGVLDVTYTNTNRINLVNMTLLKDYKTADYTEFEIDNTKSTNDAGFQISFTDLEYSPVLNTKDFKYTLVRVDGDKETILASGNFEGLTLTEFNIGKYNIIEKGIKQSYKLYLWLLETNKNQNSLEKATFKGKINITSVFKEDMPSYLSNIIIDNAKSTELTYENKTVYSDTLETSPAEEPSGENERLLLETEDDYTATTGQNSYYFRGNIIDNYVNFAGMCWRVVRIAGDGSTKLILEDQYTTCDDTEIEITSAVYTGNWNIGTGNYGFELKNIDSDSNKEIIMNYLNPVTGNTSSMVKAFYDFQTSKLADYIGKLKSGDWCLGDKAYTRSGSSGAYTYTLLEEYNYSLSMYYDAYTRLTSENANGYQPTLQCNGTILNEFANVSGVSNEAPMYVSAITADEIVYAGGKYGEANTKYYLRNNYQKTNFSSFLSLSPYFFIGDKDIAFEGHYIGELYQLNVDNSSAFRPAVSLNFSTTATTNPDTAAYGGPGTINNPYVIE